MKISVLMISAFILAPGVLKASAAADPHLPPHPHRFRGMVREQPLVIAGRRVMPGFWRSAERVGYHWVERHQDEFGRWFPGYWQPLEEYRHPDGPMAWVPGRWAHGRWMRGWWRPERKPGMTWENGFFDERGRWHPPGWREN